MEARQFLKAIGEEVSGDFTRKRSILSFEEYVALFMQNPRQQARNAAQYLRDMMDNFGTEMVDHPAGPITLSSKSGNLPSRKRRHTRISRRRFLRG